MRPEVAAVCEADVVEDSAPDSELGLEVVTVAVVVAVLDATAVPLVAVLTEACEFWVVTLRFVWTTADAEELDDGCRTADEADDAEVMVVSSVVRLPVIVELVSELAAPSGPDEEERYAARKRVLMSANPISATKSAVDLKVIFAGKKARFHHL